MNRPDLAPLLDPAFDAGAYALGEARRLVARELAGAPVAVYLFGSRLRERLAVARRALGTLEAAVALANPSDLERDGAIQRFEYTFEAAWKACRRYLETVEGVACASPKACLRGAGEVGLLDGAATALALAMADDRHLTVHTYREDLARRLHAGLPVYAALLGRLLDGMERKAAGPSGPA